MADLPSTPTRSPQMASATPASLCEARAGACVSIYSRILVTLPSRTVMSNTQLSRERLIRGFDFPVATPTTRTPVSLRHEFGGFGYVISTSSEAF
jgi:hypothetical protein